MTGTLWWYLIHLQIKDASLMVAHSKSFLKAKNCLLDFFLRHRNLHNHNLQFKITKILILQAIYCSITLLAYN